MSNILKQRLAAGQSVMTQHPPADVLSAFVERGLKDPERQKVLSHLASCAECRQAVAMAAAEAPVQESVRAARGAMLRFPAAMRWVSVAAMVAVAAGIGVLSLEHQSKQNSIVTSQPAAVSSATTKAQAPEVQNGGATRDQHSPGTSELPQHQTKSASAVAHKKNEPESAAALDKVEVLKLTGRSLETASKQGKGSAVGALVSQSDLQANSFAASPAPVIPSSQNGITAQKILAPLPPRPPTQNTYAPATAQTVQVAGASQQVLVQPNAAVSRSSDAVEVTAQAPPVRTQAFMLPSNKPAGMPALGGAMRTSTRTMTEIVSWSITTAGKLQRHLRDGAEKLIEPAPGVIVRAVAAHGIEVWAGGSEPDLSAKQWRQAPALFHSSDAGETWTKVNGPWQRPINKVALLDSDTLTVVTEDGAWTSHDAGSSWTTQ